MNKYYFLMIGMSLFNAGGAVLLKKSTGGKKFIHLLKSPYLYLGTVFYMVGGTLNILAMRYLDYSVVLPMTSLTFIWTTVMSAMFLDEKITKRKLAGLFIIIIGAVLAAY